MGNKIEEGRTAPDVATLHTWKGPGSGQTMPHTGYFQTERVHALTSYG